MVEFCLSLVILPYLVWPLKHSVILSNRMDGEELFIKSVMLVMYEFIWKTLDLGLSVSMLNYEVWFIHLLKFAP